MNLSSMSNLLCLIVGAAIIVFGVAAFIRLLSKSEKLDAIISLQETIRNICAVLFPNSGDVSVVQASEMEYFVRTPCRTGLFWFGGKPYKGSFFNANVPIGFIAQLPGKQCYRNGEVDLSPDDHNTEYSVTDASQLCFVRTLRDQTGYQKDNYATIRLLQRAKRWQILVDKSADVKTQGEQAPVLAHIAVHTEIVLDDLNARSSSDAFTEHDQYMTFVRTFAVSVIQKLALRHKYEWFVTNALEIIATLNEEWDQEIERLKNADYYECPAVQWTKTRFSGVVIKTLAARENARLRDYVLGRRGRAEQGYEIFENDLIQRVRKYASPAKNAYDSLRQEIIEFCGTEIPDAKIVVLGQNIFKIITNDASSQNGKLSNCADRIGTYFENQQSNIEEILKTNSDAVLDAVGHIGETIDSNFIAKHIGHIKYQVKAMCEAVKSIHEEAVRSSKVGRSEDVVGAVNSESKEA